MARLWRRYNGVRLSCRRGTDGDPFVHIEAWTKLPTFSNAFFAYKYLYSDSNSNEL